MFLQMCPFPDQVYIWQYIVLCFFCFFCFCIYILFREKKGFTWNWSSPGKKMNHLLHHATTAYSRIMKLLPSFLLHFISPCKVVTWNNEKWWNDENVPAFWKCFKRIDKRIKYSFSPVTAYLELCRTFTIEFFCKNPSIINAWQSFKCVFYVKHILEMLDLFKLLAWG